MRRRNDLLGQTTAPWRGSQRAATLFRAQAGTASIGGRLRALFRAGDDGQALIETAFTLSVLLMVLTGLFAFGLTFANQLSLIQATGSGAQYLAEIRTSTLTNNDPCAATLTAIESAAPYLTPSKISLSFNLNGTAITGNSCPNDQTDLVQGTSVTVTSQYPCNLLVYGVIFASGCKVNASVTEYEY